MRGPCFRALVFLLGGPSVAVAQLAGREASSGEPLPLELDWKAPAECASEAAIRSELSRIAHVKAGRTVGRLTAHGRIEKQGELYRLTLRTERSGEKGERTLAAPECRPLEREVTLVLALAFGEGVEIVEPEGLPAPAPGEPAGAAAPLSQESKPPPAEEPRETSPASVPSPALRPSNEPSRAEASRGPHLTIAALVGGGAVARVLPAPAPALFAGLDVGSPRLWLAARFTLLTTVTQRLPRDVTGEYSAAGVSLAACGGLPARSFLLGGCAGISALGLHGTSQGTTESLDGRPLWYAATASALAQWPARGTVALRLEALLGVSLTTPRFVVDGLGEAHTVPRLAPGVAGSLVLGLLD